MINKPRRIDFYPDEWIAGTLGLTAEERGVYISICALIYSHDGPIPADGLHKLCGCHAATFKKVKSRLIEAGKISSNDGQIIVKRCANELEKAHKRLGKASENGSKGGRPSKKINDIEKPSGLSDEKLAGASYNLQPTTTNLTLSNERDARASPRASHSHKQEFEDWWKGYPNKIGKGATQKAFVKALAKTSADQLTIGVERYKASKPPDRAWCNPATWLNQERWLDQPAEVRPNGSGEPFLPLHETSRRPTGPPPERL